MGQKVNPIGLRLGINQTWDSRWYASDENFANLLHEDLKIRGYLKKVNVCIRSFTHLNAKILIGMRIN